MVQSAGLAQSGGKGSLMMQPQQPPLDDSRPECRGGVSDPAIGLPTVLDGSPYTAIFERAASLWLGCFVHVLAVTHSDLHANYTERFPQARLPASTALNTSSQRHER